MKHLEEDTQQGGSFPAKLLKANLKVYGGINVVSSDNVFDDTRETALCPRTSHYRVLRSFGLLDR